VDEVPLVFFHYHRVEMRFSGRHAWRPPGYHVPRSAKRLVYRPYLQALEDALAEIRAVEPGFERGLEETPPLHVRINVARGRLGQAVRRRWPALEYVRYPTRTLARARGRPS
jgi:hypothetical protein